MDYTYPTLVARFRSEYLHGDRFAALADVCFNDHTPVDADLIRAGSALVFCSTHQLPAAFAAMRGSTHPYVLISHNSDHNVDEALYQQKPSNVLHWFAQNVLLERSDLTPIPIGLERQGIVAERDIVGSMLLQLQQGRPMRQKWCYLNINPATNDRERKKVLQRLRWKLHFVTTRTRRIAYPKYLSEMAAHRFVVSPPGNGVDCHRTWESLYLGSIPIVKASTAMHSFIPAGVYPMQDLAALTQRQLQAIDLSNDPAKAHPYLFFSYWQAQISAAVARLLPGHVATHSGPTAS
jgi:hypothetical protein